MAMRTLLCVVALAVACSSPAYDPTLEARRVGMTLSQPDPHIPAACYTRVDDGANPCWVCHTSPSLPHLTVDWPLQVARTFSPTATLNPWKALFRPVGPPPWTEDEMARWISEDNYTPLRQQLAALPDWQGLKPDLDLMRGFDAAGFALDGSGWRSFPYVPFPGWGWPTNGGTGEVMIRLPTLYRVDGDGLESASMYAQNLEILELAITTPPPRRGNPVKLPPSYVGRAQGIGPEWGLYPLGTEFLHPVRYVDLHQPGAMSTRLRELRYAKKVVASDVDSRRRRAEESVEEKEQGRPPRYAGNPEVGLVGDGGWQFQAFIEDQEGRLRVQTFEELSWCMGCHNGLGVTVDGTFSFARKSPGRQGWGRQNLVGMKDHPQWGQAEGEMLTFMRRAGAGDLLRSNTEMMDKGWEGGLLRVAEVERAGIGGDRDLAWWLLPSPQRAFLLNTAWRQKVVGQHFEEGRDLVLSPPTHLLRQVDEVDTGLQQRGKVFTDGTLYLDWAR